MNKEKGFFVERRDSAYRHMTLSCPECYQCGQYTQEQISNLPVDVNSRSTVACLYCTYRGPIVDAVITNETLPPTPSTPTEALPTEIIYDQRKQVSSIMTDFLEAIHDAEHRTKKPAARDVDDPFPHITQMSHDHQAWNSHIADRSVGELCNLAIADVRKKAPPELHRKYATLLDAWVRTRSVKKLLEHENGLLLTPSAMRFSSFCTGDNNFRIVGSVFITYRPAVNKLVTWIAVAESHYREQGELYVWAEPIEVQPYIGGIDRYGQLRENSHEEHGNQYEVNYGDNA